MLYSLKKFRDSDEKDHHRELIFSIANSPDKINHQIDLHGLQKDEAIEITRKRISDLEFEFHTKDNFFPNYGDGKNHVFKIICGAGNHSFKKKGCIKFEIKKLLEELCSKENIYENIKDGVFLIRFKK